MIIQVSIGILNIKLFGKHGMNKFLCCCFPVTPRKANKRNSKSASVINGQLLQECKSRRNIENIFLFIFKFWLFNNYSQSTFFYRLLCQRCCIKILSGKGKKISFLAIFRLSIVTLSACKNKG